MAFLPADSPPPRLLWLLLDQLPGEASGLVLAWWSLDSRWGGSPVPCGRHRLSDGCAQEEWRHLSAYALAPGRPWAVGSLGNSQETLVGVSKAKL